MSAESEEPWGMWKSKVPGIVKLIYHSNDFKYDILLCETWNKRIALYVDMGIAYITDIITQLSNIIVFCTR